ncbi:hypothetical protein SAMN05421642_103214 [Rhodococcoides kyotonense]|uniref:Uncharacterized protein n=2 Tax=Rhodococcoides kyotonense TaxID=398843 RepID=A0A239FDI9_9NOCA|nr:hypothetical protein SAMN05421642_103214 [Rhodococcus kyotonensis]
MIRAIGRGYSTIALNNGAVRTKQAAAVARRNSPTRTARGWATVGQALRSEMSKRPR